LSQPVYGRILNYRIGIRTQKSNECLVQFTDLTPKAQSGQLIGQRVVRENPKRKHVGRIVGFHGKNGVVIVRFKKGVPGQAIGTSVVLIGKKP
jgi:large subunit ribosomal protein L35Ae